MARLDGKVAIITGGASGIGWAAAERFSAEGAAVAIVDVDRQGAEEAAAKLAAAGRTAVGIGADVSSAADVDAAVARAVEVLGRLDVLFNNAGIAIGGSVLTVDEDAWDRCFAVNVKSVLLCSRAAVPHLEAAGGGSIINMASVAGLVAVENAAAYCAAKGAVISLTRNMAIDLAGRNIRVNAVCPGTVLTPMIERLVVARGDGDRDKGMAMTVAKYPMGRLGHPEEIAAVAAFLASHDASFVTGQAFTADGGMTAQ
jgi:NAD(P)-dependent dehydrogenase (short-subunit alcohol dehydrogenase family)